MRYFGGKQQIENKIHAFLKLFMLAQFFGERRMMFEVQLYFMYFGPKLDRTKMEIVFIFFYLVFFRI